MTAKLDYRWHLREVMAKRGMFSTTDLKPLLAERGIDLSASQVYRLVTEAPERLSLKTLMALLDILGCAMEELIEPVAGTSAARTSKQPAPPERTPASAVCGPSAPASFPSRPPWPVGRSGHAACAGRRGVATGPDRTRRSAGRAPNASVLARSAQAVAWLASSRPAGPTASAAAMRAPECVEPVMAATRTSSSTPVGRTAPGCAGGARSTTLPGQSRAAPAVSQNTSFTAACAAPAPSPSG